MADPKNHKEILDYLIATHSPLISGTIRRMEAKFPHLQGADAGDKWEAATHALMNAVASHDPDKGASLSSYAANKIGNSLLQRFQSSDVSAADRNMARQKAGDRTESRGTQQVGVSSGSGLDRGAIESAGGSVSEDGGSSGVSIIRNTAADFGRSLSPEARADLQRKVDNRSQQKQATNPAAPIVAPVVKPTEPEKPKIVIRRKQIESSLNPEQLDRMTRIDAHKGGK
jgi:hypothetical protein